MPLHRQILLAILIGLTLAAILSGVSAEVREPALAACHVIGTLFLNALKAVALPLVAVTLIASLGSLNQRIGRLGAFAVAFYSLSTLLAVMTGLAVANLMHPGLHATPPPGGWLHGAAASVPTQVPDWQETVLSIIPPNLIDAAAHSNLLAMVLFALCAGLAIRTLPPALRETQQAFWTGLQQILMTVVQWILRAAPLGVAALVAYAASQMGWAALKPLLWFFAAVLLGLLWHAVVNLGLVLWRLARVSPRAHAEAMSPALWMAFSTASSGAALPLTLRCLNERAHVPEEISSLTIPLGASLSLEGTALYECTAVLFLAQLLGHDLSLGQQLLVMLLSLATSIGMAGIPAASLVAISLILQRVGLPQEALALLLVTDRPLDMCRSTVSLWSDSVGARLVAAWSRPR